MDNRKVKPSERPAYDNPTGNKGGNVLTEKRRTSHARKNARRKKAAPIGHASDRKLGKKPA
jgi:hypothetical protein